MLLLTEVTGFYAVSSLLLIRKNVPLAYRQGMDAAMGGDLDFQFFHRWAGTGWGQTFYYHYVHR